MHACMPCCNGQKSVPLRMQASPRMLLPVANMPWLPRSRAGCSSLQATLPPVGLLRLLFTPQFGAMALARRSSFGKHACANLSAPDAVLVQPAPLLKASKRCRCHDARLKCHLYPRAVQRKTLHLFVLLQKPAGRARNRIAA